jgi:hypothetical protein
MEKKTMTRKKWRKRDGEGEEGKEKKGRKREGEEEEDREK